MYVWRARRRRRLISEVHSWSPVDRLRWQFLPFSPPQSATRMRRTSQSCGALWTAHMMGKLALPDFEPVHIIVVAAILSGGDAASWKLGIPLLEKLKPHIKTFYQSAATSQDLMKAGERPVQVALSINV